ncbi:hypothetical protein ACFYPC_01475 [Streptomyces sp. NPDC005808]|uniref:hypothetical protein n=1 Tax=Streptomyces sp. NPDC005808 TaxID=3364734 RepID=UPI0036CD19AF
MNTAHTEPRPVKLQAAGAAVTGAGLAYGACYVFASTEQQHEQTCAATDGLCWTWWDWAEIPVTFGTALAVLIIAYKALDIRPRIAVIPPTLLLAPIPVVAAQSTGGWWTAAVVGAAWSCSLALAAVSRHRMVCLSIAATLLLAALIVLYG